jgi:hypothetical protein
MERISSRARYRKKAQHRLEEIVQDEKRVLIIHYSCESFYDSQEGKTPRITSIAVRFMKSAQTLSFSIHKEAERAHIPIQQIEKHYDELEKAMLVDFFTFATRHGDYTWVHWNMRDANYGFPALENRFRVLGGEPYEINDDNKADLSRILIDKYSPKIAPHRRLENLMKVNDITPKDMLGGPEEALAFKSKGYIKLHQSTLRKVDILDSLLVRAEGNDLKTAATFADIYGLTPQGLLVVCYLSRMSRLEEEMLDEQGNKAVMKKRLFREADGLAREPLEAGAQGQVLALQTL